MNNNFEGLLTRAERLVEVHRAASATLKRALDAPSPKLAARIRRRRAGIADPSVLNLRSNRTLRQQVRDAEQAGLDLDHPSEHHPGPLATPEAAQGEGRCVTLSVRELHTLLRAAMPPGRTQRTRRAHARIGVALELFAHELGELRGLAPSQGALDAAHTLASTLDAWIAQARRALADEEAAAAKLHAAASRAARAEKARGKRDISLLRRTTETAVPVPLRHGRAA